MAVNESGLQFDWEDTRFMEVLRTRNRWGFDKLNHARRPVSQTRYFLTRQLNDKFEANIWHNTTFLCRFFPLQVGTRTEEMQSYPEHAAMSVPTLCKKIADEIELWKLSIKISLMSESCTEKFVLSSYAIEMQRFCVFTNNNGYIWEHRVNWQIRVTLILSRKFLIYA
jgi:hypothetical protein